MPAPTPNDLIDRVDDQDNVVGTVRRGDALTQGVGFRVVHGLVQDDRGRLLVQQVGRAGTRSPGRWGSSVAGYLHAGESPSAGAARRLREELDIDAPVRFCGRTQMRDVESRKFIYVYLARTDRPPHIVDPGHVSAVRYATVQDLSRELEETPDAFTPTFRVVFELARPSLG